MGSGNLGWRRGCIASSIAVWALAWVAWCALTAGVHSLAEAAQIRLSQGGSPAFYLGNLTPGQRYILPHAGHVTVFSTEEWDLEVYLRESSSAATDSQVFLTLAEIDELQERGTRRLKNEVDPGSGGATSIRRQPPTGPSGRTLSFDLTVIPSWDDPAGTELTATIDSHLSTTGLIIPSFVTPNPVRLGSPVAVWFPSSTGGGTVIDSEDQVLLVVTDLNDQTVIQTQTKAEQVVEGSDTLPWRRVLWHPQSNLLPGIYRYQLLANEGELIAQGVFRAIPGRLSTDARDASDVSLLATDTDAPLAAEQDGFAVLPDVRIEVRSQGAAAGERADVTLRLINGSSIPIYNVQVDLCLPEGWHWISSFTPWMPIPRTVEVGSDSTVCRRHLMGSVGPNREQEIELQVMRWPARPLLPFGYHQAPVMRAVVKAAPREGAALKQLYETTALLAQGTDLLTPVVRLHGRVFIDVNRSGGWEEGEPGIAGLSVVADGIEVARTRQDGSYDVQLPAFPTALWARPGRDGARSSIHFLNPALGDDQLIDLPVSFVDPVEREAFLSIAGVAGNSGIEGAGVARTHVEGDWGYLDVGVQATDARINSFAGETQSASNDVFRRPVITRWIEARKKEDTVTWEAQFRQGVPQRIRWGELRPSQPVSEAWRLGASGALLFHTDAVENSPWMSWSGETGAAAGDLWRCRLMHGQSVWYMGDWDVTFTATSVDHRAFDAHGTEQATAAEAEAALHGSMSLREYVWPYRLSVGKGWPRTLSPSCGHTPAPGWNWSFHTLAPQHEGSLEALNVSGRIWPDDSYLFEIDPEEEDEDLGDWLSRDESEGDLKDPSSDDSGGGNERRVFRQIPHVSEVEAALRPYELPLLGGTRLTSRVALQWGVAEPPSEGEAPRPFRGAGIRFDIDTGVEKGLLQRLRLEVGAPPAGGIRTPRELERLDHRFALDWRISAGTWRPWIRYEVGGAKENRKHTGELGLGLNTNLNWSQLPVPGLLTLGRSLGFQAERPVQIAANVSRAYRVNTAMDRMNIAFTQGSNRHQIRWQGRSPIERPGTPFSQEGYDRIRWQLNFERRWDGVDLSSERSMEPFVEGMEGSSREGLTKGFRRRPWAFTGWSFSIDSRANWTELAQEPSESEHQANVALGGSWPSGTWRLGVGGSIHSKHDGWIEYRSIFGGVTYSQGIFSWRADAALKSSLMGDQRSFLDLRLLTSLRLTESVDLAFETERLDIPLTGVEARRFVGVDWRPKMGENSPVAIRFGVEKKEVFVGAGKEENPKHRLRVQVSAPILW